MLKLELSRLVLSKSELILNEIFLRKDDPSKTFTGTLGYFVDVLLLFQRRGKRQKRANDISWLLRRSLERRNS